MIRIPNDTNKILSILKESGFEAFVVGGCVRDSLLNIQPHDWDIATNASPQSIIKCFNKFNLVTTGLKHGTVGVVYNKEVYEITTYRIDGEYSDNRHPKSVLFTKNIVDDLRRRDFTINAMACNDVNGLIDPFCGKKDIANKCICCVGNADERFSEDALRIMRALRFASIYGFSIEKRTAESIYKNRFLLKNISVERISSEFSKLLCGKSAYEILDKFKDVIAVFIPEIQIMFGFNQDNPHHDKTLWYHTLSSLIQIESDLTLRATMFFHDIGKPEARKYDEIKKLCHFKGHNKYSAEKTEVILKRLKFPNTFIETVTTLIKYHDVRFSDNKRQIKHVMSAIGNDNFSKLLKVQRADLMAQSMYMREEKLEKFEKAVNTYKEITIENDCFTLKNLKINGNDLIQLGITDGKKIGSILKILLSMVIDEKLENKYDSLVSMALKLNI